MYHTFTPLYKKYLPKIRNSAIFKMKTDKKFAHLLIAQKIKACVT